MLLGLRTLICPPPDRDAAEAWLFGTFGLSPYFDEPFNVGYSVGGHELGLDPGAGEGIEVATLRLPWTTGTTGVIENPNSATAG